MPQFRYHPDPVGSRSAVADEQPCSICRRPAGLRYDGPIYGRQADVLCLDCIHSGRAAEALAVIEGQPADFTDIDQDGSWDGVPAAVVDEVLHRTPGFRGWQHERWLAHCDDACEFLGPAGWKELETFGADAVSAVREEMVGYGWSVEELDEYLRSLSTTGDAEPVKPGETTCYADLMSAWGVGSLIQAMVGIRGGSGLWCRNLAGLAA